MRASSLALRLFLSATAWTVVILVATGIILSSIYHDAVERSFDRRLGVYLSTLVADVAAPEQSADHGTPALGEPLFELPLSGWYWQIAALDGGKPDIRSSGSLRDIGLPRLRDENATTGPDGITRHGYAALAIGPEEQRLRLIERTVDLGEDGRYLIAVAGDPQEIDDEIRAFDRALLVTFMTLAVVLLVHALKTPLSVLVNEAGGRDDPLAAKVTEQANIMRDQIARHLERARLAAGLKVVGSVTDVVPVVTALTRTMEKIHQNRGIAIDLDAPVEVRFRGERQDL